MRRMDIIRLSGAAMWVAGVFLFFPAPAERMDWEHWLAGCGLCLRRDLALVALVTIAGAEGGAKVRQTALCYPLPGA